MNVFGLPVAGTVLTGQVTLPTTGRQLVAAGATANLRAVFLTALPGNTADDIVFGGAGAVTASGAAGGAPLPKGVRTPVPVDDLAKLDCVGTAGGVVAWEAYR